MALIQTGSKKGWSAELKYDNLKEIMSLGIFTVHPHRARVILVKIRYGFLVAQQIALRNFKYFQPYHAQGVFFPPQ